MNFEKQITINNINSDDNKYKVTMNLIDQMP